MPSSAFPDNSFEDSTETFATQVSRNYRPTNGQNLNDSPDAFNGEYRRPSTASATTASSVGSRSSAGASRQFSKRLHGFFGDDFHNHISPRASETNLLGRMDGGMEQPFRSHRRDKSTNTAGSTEVWAGSRPGSRPETPVPSNDVVPFLYQDPDVSPLLRSKPSLIFGLIKSMDASHFFW